MPRLNLIGEIYGRLTVVALDHTDGKTAYWRCVCSCGNEKIVRTTNLRQGTVKSCGCLAREVHHEQGLTVP